MIVKSEKQIDQLIYKLYALTPEEIKKDLKYLRFKNNYAIFIFKRTYQKEHDEFHSFTFKTLRADPEKDNFYAFLKKMVLADIQSRHGNLTKYKVLQTFDDLKKVKLDKQFEKPEELLDDLYKKLLSVKNIGGKIAALVLKNLVYFGDTEKYFGFKKKQLLPYLLLPVDVHIKNLLCYRLQIIKPDLHDKIKTKNTKFQDELRELCRESNILNPVDLDILWYIGYQNCNRRVYCSVCKMGEYCKDRNFEIEAKKNIGRRKGIEEEIEEVKTHPEIKF